MSTNDTIAAYIERLNAAAYRGLGADYTAEDARRFRDAVEDTDLEGLDRVRGLVAADAVHPDEMNHVISVVNAVLNHPAKG